MSYVAFELIYKQLIQRFLVRELIVCHINHQKLLIIVFIVRRFYSMNYDVLEIILHYILFSKKTILRLIVSDQCIYVYNFLFQINYHER